MRWLPYLCDTTIGTFESGFDTHGRFIGELDGCLQQVDWELGMGLSCQPQTESVMDILSCQDLKSETTWVSPMSL